MENKSVLTCPTCGKQVKFMVGMTQKDVLINHFQSCLVKRELRTNLPQPEVVENTVEEKPAEIEQTELKPETTEKYQAKVGYASKNRHRTKTFTS